MKFADDLIRSMISAIQNLQGEGGFTDAVAEQIEQQLRMKFGGSSIYIPKIDRDARRDAILREFNGRNRKDVCSKHSLSKAQFYRLLKGD